MFAVVYWVILGAIAGGIARAVVPSKLPGGWLPTIGLGVAGSFAGGLPFGDGPAGLAGSIAGALVLSVLYRVWSENNA